MDTRSVIYRKKCVISNINGTKWANEYDSVFSFESENYIACAKAIELASNDLTINETDVEAIKEKYSINKWCERIVDIYNLN